MICPICGGINEEESKFCGKCGVIIPRCPSCNKVIAKRMRFCLFDGTELPESILHVFKDNDKKSTGSQLSETIAVTTDTPVSKANSSSNYTVDGTDIRGKNEVNIVSHSPKMRSEIHKKRFCLKCGLPCQPGQDICESCQAKAQEISNKYSSTNNHKGKNYFIIIVISILVLLALIGSIAYFFFGRSVGNYINSDNDNGETKVISEGNEDKSRSSEHEENTEMGNSANPLIGTEKNDEGSTVLEDYSDNSSIYEQLFSEKVAQDIMNTTYFGADITKACNDGWADKWIYLYYYGSSEPTEEDVENRTHGISIESWLMEFITYDKAKAAGWGDAWLSLSAGYISAAEMDVPSNDDLTIQDQLLYFVNNCDSQYFSREDLDGFDASMAILARNAPYAHAGRIFTTDSIRSFFEQFSWYHPVIEPDAFKETMLNDYETANKNLVVAFEKEMGYK